MSLTKHAFAKINLTLDVLNKREDGYHNIVSIMQSISLCDIVTIDKAGNGINVLWKERGSADRSNIADSSNTAYRAAKLMLEKYNIKSGVKIEIIKNIPVSAGLGGGSADAASVIEGIDELFELKAPMSELMVIGAAVGADVPFCIHKGAALAEGIGEKIRGFQSKMECYVVLAKPRVEVSTKEIYAKIDKLALTRTLDMRLAAEAMKASDFKNLGQNLYNAMELVTAEEYPVIKQLKKKMAMQGACGSLMSGSGPTVYGLFENRIQAENAFTYFNGKEEIEAFICEFYYPNCSKNM